MDAPSTEREKVPGARADPVSGILRGELGSELVTVSEPVRMPGVDGVKVSVTAQLAPVARMVEEHGVVMV